MTYLTECGCRSADMLSCVNGGGIVQNLTAGTLEGLKSHQAAGIPQKH